MKKVYVAHPYGGHEENKQNVERIIREMLMRNPNVIYFSPIHAFGYLYDDVEYELGLAYCLEMMVQCHEVLLCPGWQDSRGCKAEVDYAKKCHIPIRVLHDK